MLACLLTLLAGLAIPARAVDLTGDMVQGGMVVGRVAPGASVWLDGEPVKVTPGGRFVIGFGRDAESATLRVLTGDEDKTYPLTIEQRQFDIERVDGLPPRTVNIPPEEAKRRQRERTMVGKARSGLSDMLHWADGFAWPAKGRVSGVYGSQRILNGEPRWPHYGLDVAGPTGTPVVAPAAGVVTLAEPDFLLEGGIIIIDHGYGVTSTLFHLHSVDVAVGQAVAQGDPIGTIGATGRASGPHVDWRVNWKSVRLDPQLLVGQMPE